MEFERNVTLHDSVASAQFPSPCGVMEFEPQAQQQQFPASNTPVRAFPSPFGVMEFELSKLSFVCSVLF